MSREKFHQPRSSSSSSADLVKLKFSGSSRTTNQVAAPKVAQQNSSMAQGVGRVLRDCRPDSGNYLWPQLQPSTALPISSTRRGQQLKVICFRWRLSLHKIVINKSRLVACRRRSGKVLNLGCGGSPAK